MKILNASGTVSACVCFFFVTENYLGILGDGKTVSNKKETLALIC